MKKNMIAAALLFGVSAGAAQADLLIQGQHTPTVAGAIETYFFQATSTGNTDIFYQSDVSNAWGFPTYLDGLLSVWQLTGSGATWTLVGANDNAPRNMTGASPGSTTVYGTNTNDFITGQPGSGTQDPGLSLNVTTNSTYMVINSEYLNGPTSLADGATLDPTVNFESFLAGTLGQTMAVGSNYRAALKNGASEFWNGADPISYDYHLHINGNVVLASAPAPAAVPLPAAVWLFGSALAGFAALGRKKSKQLLVA